MPSISVIVPVYKVEAYLNRCVDSILAQSFTDFELILVDDGSPDRCGEICDKYAQKDSRIKVIHKENGGLSSARNCGIEWAFKNSDSQWLNFIDSDDWIHPCFLECLYRGVKEYGTRISVCNATKTSEDRVMFLPVKPEFTVRDAMEFYMDTYIWATVAWNKLYHKSLFENCRYPVGKLHEDEFVTYRLLYEVKTIIWIEAPLYQYYQRADSIMGHFSLSRLDCLEASEEQCRFFKDKERKIYINRVEALICRYSKYIAQTECDYPETSERLKKERKNKMKNYRWEFRFRLKKDEYLYELLWPRRVRFCELLKNGLDRLKTMW